MGTRFSEVYNRFLEKITDDMYIELTPQDTVRDLQRTLLHAIPGFEFPRQNLTLYDLSTETLSLSEVQADDFVLGTIWNELPDDITTTTTTVTTTVTSSDGTSTTTTTTSTDTDKYVLVERSSFSAELNSEEINILAILMLCVWLQRQIASIENTRMKYSGTDFKMTSQANHLSKLLSLFNECHRQSIHYQRLYKRRRINSEDGLYRSNWDMFNTYG